MVLYRETETDQLYEMKLRSTDIHWLVMMSRIF